MKNYLSVIALIVNMEELIRIEVHFQSKKYFFLLKRQRPTAQGRRCKCTGCSESTACHRPRFPQQVAPSRPPLAFSQESTPNFFPQALQQPTAQGRRCKCTGCSESTACHRPRFPPASGAFRAASCFLSESTPNFFLQALPQKTPIFTHNPTFRSFLQKI